MPVIVGAVAVALFAIGRMDERYPALNETVREITGRAVSRFIPARAPGVTWAGEATPPGLANLLRSTDYQLSDYALPAVGASETVSFAATR